MRRSASAPEQAGAPSSGLSPALAPAIVGHTGPAPLLPSTLCEQPALDLNVGRRGVQT